MVRLVLLPLFCTMPGACSLDLGHDPYKDLASDTCAAGNSRIDGSACQLPNADIAIDGDSDDWSLVPTVYLNTDCANSPCGDAVPSELRTAMFEEVDPADESKTVEMIGFRVRLSQEAAPVQDAPSLRYVLNIGPTAAYEDRMRDAFVAGDGLFSYRKNQYPVRTAFATSARPFALNWTYDGFEAAVQRRFLSFVHGAVVTVNVQRKQGDDWISLLDQPTQVSVCWAGDDIRLDPCRGEPQ